MSGGLINRIDLTTTKRELSTSLHGKIHTHKIKQTHRRKNHSLGKKFTQPLPPYENATTDTPPQPTTLTPHFRNLSKTPLLHTHNLTQVPKNPVRIQGPTKPQHHNLSLVCIYQVSFNPFTVKMTNAPPGYITFYPFYGTVTNVDGRYEDIAGQDMTSKTAALSFFQPHFAPFEKY